MPSSINLNQKTLTSQTVYLPSTPPHPQTPPSPVPHYHVFFIPGNPGCISYYHPYLTSLASHFSSTISGSCNNVSVYGTSMANFSDEDDGTGISEYGNGRKVLGLQEQIEFVEARLRDYVRLHAEAADEGRERQQQRVIIVGHSVGAYMGLEVIRRERERLKEGKGMEGRIVGFVGLWPTITFIARSKSGQKLALLRYVPNLSSLVGMLARFLAACLGHTLLLAVVRLITRFPEHMAEVTASFVASRRGVQQALHMGRDEMVEITEDRWDEDMWGAATPSPDYERPKLVFYFGTNDHWVADHTRDQLIAARGYQEKGEDWKPRMFIDDMGIPHSFCIRHGTIVAKKTFEWMTTIIEGSA